MDTEGFVSQGKFASVSWRPNPVGTFSLIRLSALGYGSNWKERKLGCSLIRSWCIFEQFLEHLTQIRCCQVSSTTNEASYVVWRESRVRLGRDGYMLSQPLRSYTTILQMAPQFFKKMASNCIELVQFWSFQAPSQPAEYSGTKTESRDMCWSCNKDTYAIGSAQTLPKHLRSNPMRWATSQGYGKPVGM